MDVWHIQTLPHQFPPKFCGQATYIENHLNHRHCNSCFALELELWRFTYLRFCGKLCNCLHKDYARLLVILKNLQDGPCCCHFFLLSFSFPFRSVSLITAPSYQFFHDMGKYAHCSLPHTENKAIHDLAHRIQPKSQTPLTSKAHDCGSLLLLHMAKFVVHNGHQMDTIIWLYASQ